MRVAGISDIELLAASSEGQIEAFATLVRRYESLVCAVSYSATGDRTLSEDIAQDTFIAAWRSLGSIRDASKIRAWLCGIARNLSSKALRRAGREIPCEGDIEAAVGKLENASESPLELALEKEMESLVWLALAEVPEKYREPLVLFYREDQSTTQVAELLGLSENAVQQRLSRGRQYLRASVVARVESTLRRSKAPRGIAAGVIAAISTGALTTTAEAATQRDPPLDGSVGSALNTAGILTMKKALIAGASALLLLLLAPTALRALGGSSASSGEEADVAGKSARAPSAPQASPPAVVVPRQTPAPKTALAPLLPAKPSEASGATANEAAPPAPFTSRSFRKSLLQQLANAEPVWQECVQGVNDDARSTNGAIALHFIISNGGSDGDSQAVVETSEIDHDSTTLDSEELQDCILATPEQMTFALLPEDISAVSIGFAIHFENGAFVESTGKEYSFLRDDDPILQGLDEPEPGDEAPSD